VFIHVEFNFLKEIKYTEKRVKGIMLGVGANSNCSSDQEFILYCQKQIQKSTGEDRWLHYIGRLKRLRIKVKDLVFTGIGRTIKELSQRDDKVGQEASDLVKQWNSLLVESEETEKSSSGVSRTCAYACASKSSPENNVQTQKAYPHKLMEIKGLKVIRKYSSGLITKIKPTNNIVMPDTGVYRKVGPKLKQYICIVEGCRNKFATDGSGNLFVFKDRQRFLNNHFKKYHQNLAINYIEPVS